MTTSDELREWFNTTQFTKLGSDTQFHDGLPAVQPDEGDEEEPDEE